MGNSEIITCPRHPKTVTYLRCGGCNTPICPACAVQTPVGFKCKSCGTLKQTALFTVSPWRAAAMFFVGLLAGMLAGLLLPFLGFFSIWVALPCGRFLGNLLLRVSGHKLGLLPEVLTGASIIIGGIGVRAAWIYWQHAQALTMATHAHLPPTLLSPLDPLTLLLTIGPYTIIGTVIVAAAAVSCFRFMWKFWGF